MYSFEYEYPVKVFFGEGSAAEKLTSQLDALGGRILLTYGGSSAKKNGTLDEVLSLIRAAGKSVVEFSGIMPNPTWKKVQEGAELARKEKVTGVLALGGGSVIDASKIIALQAVNTASVWDVEINRKGSLDHPALPLGAIVTASGTGSEMNGGAVITNEEEKIKTGLFAPAARFAFLDYHFMESLPARQVLSGAFDTLSHALETYLGRSDELNVSDDVSLAVMKNTVDNIHRIVTDIHDKEARGNLMWDSAMAENGILKVGRVTDFEVHMIEHQFGAYTDCNYGEGLAVIQPVYCTHVLDAALSKLARFARVVFAVSEADDRTAAEKGINALYDLISEMGLPHRLSQLRMKDSADVLLTDETLRRVADSTFLLSGGPRKLTSDEVFQILRECM